MLCQYHDDGGECSRVATYLLVAPSRGSFHADTRLEDEKQDHLFLCMAHLGVVMLTRPEWVVYENDPRECHLCMQAIIHDEDMEYVTIESNGRQVVRCKNRQNCLTTYVALVAELFGPKSATDAESTWIAMNTLLSMQNDDAELGFDDDEPKFATVEDDSED